MDQAEDFGARGEGFEGFEDGREGLEVALFELAGFDVEDVDEDTDFGENVGLLGGQVIFSERILSGYQVSAWFPTT